MAQEPTGSDLGARIEALKEKSDETVNVSDIQNLLDDVIGVLNRPMPPTDPRFYTELESVAQYIQNTRAEIAALRPDSVKEEYIQTAADELDAIVEATAEATHTIMDAAELIEDATDKATDDVQKALTEATTKIYEACTFQDITGQRITKVVNALKGIEEKIDDLLAAFGADSGQASAKKKQKKKSQDEITDEDLLNGPQHKGDAKSQDEIDALFDSIE